jgi:hypothetical protein
MAENDDFSREQWDRLDRWLFHHLANVGMGMEGEPRQETQRGFWFLNERRRKWDDKDEIADREFVRRSRESHEDRKTRFRGWVWGVLALLASIIVPFILAKLGLK